METTKEVIRETLTLYEQYCKILDLLEPDKLPPITLNETEYMTALVHPLRQKQAKKKLNTVLGQCTHKWKNYNDVIFINTKKFKHLRGLHEYKEPKIIKKETRNYIRTYMIRTKIGHLEETLIHELVHVKYPKLRHGKKFNQIVRNIYLSNNHISNEKQ